MDDFPGMMGKRNDEKILLTNPKASTCVFFYNVVVSFARLRVCNRESVLLVVLFMDTLFGSPLYLEIFMSQYMS